MVHLLVYSVVCCRWQSGGSDVQVHSGGDQQTEGNPAQSGHHGQEPPMVSNTPVRQKPPVVSNIPSLSGTCGENSPVVVKTPFLVSNLSNLP